MTDATNPTSALAELARLFPLTTQGEWYHACYSHGEPDYSPPAPTEHVVSPYEDDVCDAIAWCGHEDCSEANAQFTALAHNAFQAIQTRMRELEAENRRPAVNAITEHPEFDGMRKMLDKLQLLEKFEDVLRREFLLTTEHDMGWTINVVKRAINDLDDAYSVLKVGC